MIQVTCYKAGKFAEARDVANTNASFLFIRRHDSILELVTETQRYVAISSVEIALIPIDWIPLLCLCSRIFKCWLGLNGVTVGAIRPVASHGTADGLEA